MKLQIYLIFIKLTSSSCANDQDDSDCNYDERCQGIYDSSGTLLGSAYCDSEYNCFMIDTDQDQVPICYSEIPSDMTAEDVVIQMNAALAAGLTVE